MSKFNTSTKKIIGKNLPDTVNYAGGKAFSISNKEKFASILISTFLEDIFYKKSETTISEIKKYSKQLIDSGDAEFVMKAAIYARNLGFRSTTHIVAGELAEHGKGSKDIRNFFDSVVQRVDDMIEIISYYEQEYNHKRNNGKLKLPICLKEGFKSAFDKFDEYQLSKYKKETKNWSLIDVVNMIRPVPCDNNREALSKLVKGELKNIDTHESMMVEAGKKSESEDDLVNAKSEVWHKLLSEKRLGYLALIRNLRNIVETVNRLDTIDFAYNLLINKNALKNAKIFPFQLFVAYDIVINLTPSTEIQRLCKKKFVDGLTKAIDNSVECCPKFEGKTLVVIDESGSMSHKISNTTYCTNKTQKRKTAFDNLARYMLASIFAIATAKTNDADFMAFDTTSRYITNINYNDSVITCVEKIKRPSGGATYYNQIFKLANQKYDRIFIFTDEQGWGESNELPEYVKSYKKLYNADPFIYTIDLTGSSTTMFKPGNKYFKVSGFSDSIYKLIELSEINKNALISEIENIVL